MRRAIWKANFLRCFLVLYLKEVVSKNNQEWCTLEKKVSKPDSSGQEVYQESPDASVPDDVISDPNEIAEINEPLSGIDMQGIYNNPEAVKNNDLWDGDMLMTKDQMKYLQSSEQEFGAATLSKKTRWPNGKIFYVIDGSVAHVEEMIRDAMDKWSSKTCIQFIPASDSIPDRVKFQRTGYGCFSHVGKVGGEQPLSIDRGCEQVKIVAHEIGHAIGLWHEQTRKDRDNFLATHLENVREMNRKNYDIPADFTSGDTPYDFGSIMHYEFTAFTKNRRYTMVSRDPFEEANMYNSKQPSFFDYKIVNKIYDCAVPCENSPINCRNGGIRTSNARGECICFCRDKYGGRSCEMEENIPDCHEKVTEPKTIRSPSPFPPNWVCVYWIEAPRGLKVRLTFERFHLMFCGKEFLKLRLDNADSDDPGTKFCGFALQGKSFQSVQDQIILVLKTTAQSSPGFEATVTFE